MKIKYFAWIIEITKNEEEFLDNTKIDSIDKLKDYLVNKYPDIKKHIDSEILRFAVNQEYVSDNVELKSNDEIAIFPPVSGG